MRRVPMQYHERNGSAGAPLILGVALVCGMSAVYLLTWLGWLVGLAPGWWVLALAAMAGLLPVVHGAGGAGGGWRGWAWGGVVPVVVLVLAARVGLSVWDVSPDGLAYHHAAVWRQLTGWNPLRGAVPDSVNAIWIDSYPKASWLVGASLASVFGSAEALKAQNLIFALAAGCLVFAALRSALPEMGAGLSAMAALVAALNPVVVCQWFTSYNDGLLASQLSCVVALGVLWFTSPQHRLVLPALLMLLPYTLNLKFTAVPYVGVLWLGLVAILFWRRQLFQSRGFVVATLVSCAVGVLVLGATPYVTNLLAHGHPFYPLMGAGKIDIMASNAPAGWPQMGYLQRLVNGLFAEPTSSRDAGVHFFFPFAPRPYYFARFKVADMLIGGFGPLFGAAVLVLAAGAAASLRSLIAGQRLVLALAGVVLCSALINPESWWARYVPQLWLAVVLLAAALMSSSSRLARGAGTLAVAILLVNAAVIVAVSSTAAVADSNTWRALPQALHAAGRDKAPLRIDFGPQEAAAPRLEALGIGFVALQGLNTCRHVESLIAKPKAYLSTARICLD